MSRSPLPLVVADVSAFAQHLRKHWPIEPPGQSQTLALVAQAAGYRNHQHLKADADADEAPNDAAAKHVTEALRVFDAHGTMTRWPQKTVVQRLCLMWFWSRLPGRVDMTEPQVNAVLKASERFGDHVLLRRSLIDHGFVKRSNDGRIYRRIEARPTPEERRLIRTLSERQFARAT